MVVAALVVAVELAGTAMVAASHSDRRNPCSPCQNHTFGTPCQGRRHRIRRPIQMRTCCYTPLAQPEAGQAGTQATEDAVEGERLRT